MSRSHFKQKADPYKRDNEVLQKNLEASRRYQYRVHKKPPGLGGKKKTRAQRQLRYPPITGWEGGHWEKNLGFTTPQKSG